MRIRAMLLIWSVLACKSTPVAQPADPASCLDLQLSQRGLNSFGDPPDTVYAGGSPLFDEKTGQGRDRTSYVYARHPEIARACDAGP